MQSLACRSDLGTHARATHFSLMSDTDIKREPRGSGEQYVLMVDGHKAVLTFQDVEGDKRITDHTLVPRELGGRGIGKKLVARAVEDARSEGKSIVPTCWFVKQQIDRHEEWRDVLA